MQNADYTAAELRAGGLFVLTAPDEFYVSASGGPVTITFTPNTPGPPLVGVGTINEGSLVDGRWVQGRRLDHSVTTNNDMGALRVPGAYDRSEDSILRVAVPLAMRPARASFRWRF